MDIIKTLLTAALKLDDKSYGSECRLGHASSADWDNVLRECHIHKIAPLIGYTILTYRLSDVIPSEVVNVLTTAYKKTLLTNRVIFGLLSLTIRALRQTGIEPTVFKGVVLADSFYPDPGTRSMADIDFLILPRHRELAAQVLLESGFHRIKDVSTQEDASSYGNDYGVLLDVHHRFRLFEQKDSESLAIDLKPRFINLETLHVWDPSAMLVHLVTHLDGHRREDGYRLSWIMDLGYVVRKWGLKLDWEKIQRLLPDERLARETIRLLLFLDREFEVAVPGPLVLHVGTVRPLSLKAVLRSARLAPWGLPRPRGWIRLFADRLGVVRRGNRLFPSLSDLFLWPMDFVLENLIPGKVTHQHSTD
jgi:hypothetical protein